MKVIFILLLLMKGVLATPSFDAQLTSLRLEKTQLEKDNIDLNKKYIETQERLEKGKKKHKFLLGTSIVFGSSAVLTSGGAIVSKINKVNLKNKVSSKFLQISNLTNV